MRQNQQKQPNMESYKNLSYLDIVAGFIHIKYKVSKEMAYEAAQQFNNPHMSVQKCVWLTQICRFHSRIEQKQNYT